MQRETVDRRAVLESLYEEHRRLLSSWTAAGETLRPVFGEGPVGAAAMLVGEAPGAEETELGRPFVGRAGRSAERLPGGGPAWSGGNCMSPTPSNTAPTG